jgi:atypical dual specificity phosphatase
VALAARAATERTRSLGPRGFFWILPGRLAGLPRPGIIAELEDDLAGLSRVGVTLLVTLEEMRTIDAVALATNGVDAVHFPVPDMGAPELGPTVELCSEIARRMAAGVVVAFHCRAGLGRTGTLLACQLVWAGGTALDAIDRVRRVNPRCIQSDTQAAFIQAFEVALRTDAPRTPRSTDPAVPSTERTTNVT